MEEKENNKNEEIESPSLLEIFRNRNKDTRPVWLMVIDRLIEISVILLVLYFVYIKWLNPTCDPRIVCKEYIDVIVDSGKGLLPLGGLIWSKKK